MNFMDLPKIELHCHLDGSVRPETIIDIAKKEKIELNTYNVEDVKAMVTAPLECESLDEYLKRFQLPISIMQTKEGLKRVAYELLEDCAKENIKYIEIRFAPLLHMEKGLSIEEIIESVLEGIKAGKEKYDIKGNLILSCLKTMPVETVYEVIEAGKKFIGNGVVAIDLAGAEKEGFSKEFVQPMALAKQYGYRITIHAGETGFGKNVLEAIEFLGAERIGHGVFITNCDEAYELVKKKGIALEICPTSNVQTKAVQAFNDHPIYEFYKDGIKVTLNTDNRTVSDTDMTKECNILYNEFKIDYEDYKQIYYNSIDAAFIDENTKKKLKEYINLN